MGKVDKYIKKIEEEGFFKKNKVWIIAGGVFIVIVIIGLLK